MLLGAAALIDVADFHMRVDDVAIALIVARRCGVRRDPTTSLYC